MPELRISVHSSNDGHENAPGAMTLISALSDFSGHKFNPQPLVKAVNHLRMLGREAALETLREYCALAEQAAEMEPENAILVARVLFVRKGRQAALLRLSLGRPDLAEPKDLTLFPLFPLHLYRDIPFLLVGGYILGGEASPPLEYVNWCARECDIRSKPLTPANNPVACVDEFLESGTSKELNLSGPQQGMLRLQALRSVTNVYPITEQEERELLSVATSSEAWKTHRGALASIPITWNPERNEYEKQK